MIREYKNFTRKEKNNKNRNELNFESLKSLIQNTTIYQKE